MLLKTGQCFTNELELNANQVVIAEVFNDCNGDPHAPGAQLAKCSDIPGAQTLILSGQDLTLSGGGGTVTLPDSDAQAISISGNVISLTNGGSVTLPAAVAGPAFATPAQAQTGTSATLMINPADLYARENIAAQTGVSNDLAAIPAPGPGQSPWATNQLGERLHYMPNVGWLMVNNGHVIELPITPTTLTTVPIVVASAVMPRAGVIDIVSSLGVTYDIAQTTNVEIQTTVQINGAPVQHVYFTGGARTFNANCNGQNFPVAAGDVVSLAVNKSPDYPGTGVASTTEYFYRQNQVRYIA